MIQYTLVMGQSSVGQAWNAFEVNWNFRPTYTAAMEVDYDWQISGLQEWHEFTVKPSFQYNVTNTIGLIGGLLLRSTKQNDLDDTKEVRPYLGVQWDITKAERRVYMNTLLRYEQRFFYSNGESTSQASRARLRFDAIVSITKPNYISDKNLYFKTQSEAFFNFENDNISETYKSQFRQYFIFGYRYSYSWRFELGYSYQASRNSITESSLENKVNAISTTIKYYIPRKKE